MSEWLKSAFELSKQLQALVAGSLPILTPRLVSTLNPQIYEDLWVVTSLLALIASAISYNLTQDGSKPKFGWYLGCMGLLMVGVSFAVVLALVQDVFLPQHPSGQYLVAEFAFVNVF